MQNASKPFGERATGSFSYLFTGTQLTLTLVYVAILAVILTISGGVSHYVFSARLQHRFIEITTVRNILERQPALVPTAREIETDLQEIMLLVNGFLLLLAGVLSYGLAGITMYPIREAYERQRRFLSDASHELRTPLAILQTELENERRTTTQSEQLERIESHLEEVHRMGYLVNDLLTLSQLSEDEDIVTKKTAVDVSEMLATTINRLRPLAKQNNIQLFFEPTASNMMVLCDDVLLSQALTNVIKNAIHYNKPEGRVHIRLQKQKHIAVIEVEDTGIGMTGEDVEHAFDRFYRADKSRSRRTGGSGLGLAITKAIFEAHNGTIRLKSKPNFGTTVTITLPVIHNAS